MINIYKNIYKKINISIFNSKLTEIKDKIKIINDINIKNGHLKLNGIQFFIKKFNLNKNKLINNLELNLTKLNFISKIYINNLVINIFIKNKYIETKLKKIILSENFNFKYKCSKNIVIDYSSPNLMKEMHVGHLRSTIIGDSMFRILNFLGNNVTRINHVGDWGINFGMVICKIIELDKYKDLTCKNISIEEIEEIYKTSKLDYKNNLNFKKKSGFFLKKLQDNDSLCKKIWSILVKISIKNNQKIYKKLSINLNINNIVGESFYNNKIKNTINDLLYKKIAIKKDKMILIPLKNIKNRFGKSMCIIIQKSDETYLYSTIEITSIRYRCKFLKVNEIIYFIDKRQSDHLEQSFLISKKANYLLKTKLKYHSFGMILDKDYKPFKTREGNSFKLKDLINKSIEKTKEFIILKNKNINLNRINKLSKIIGIGSLKYFDLSKNRKNNYIFDINKILSLNNNTAIYIYYSYVRILSILRKNKIKKPNKLYYINKLKFIINNDEELNLSLSIIKFEYILYKVSILCIPNLLCSYLYEISKKFSKFYLKDNILKISNLKIKNSKLNLCILTARIIKKGFNLLGIKIIEKM